MKFKKKYYIGTTERDDSLVLKVLMRPCGLRDGAVFTEIGCIGSNQQWTDRTLSNYRWHVTEFSEIDKGYDTIEEAMSKNFEMFL